MGKRCDVMTLREAPTHCGLPNTIQPEAGGAQNHLILSAELGAAGVKSSDQRFAAQVQRDFDSRARDAFSRNNRALKIAHDDVVCLHFQVLAYPAAILPQPAIDQERIADFSRDRAVIANVQHDAQVRLLAPANDDAGVAFPVADRLGSERVLFCGQLAGADRRCDEQDEHR